MAVSDISGATSSANLGATQVTGVQRVEQRQLEAAAQAEGQDQQQAETGASEATGVAAQATETGTEDGTTTETARGSILDITV
jgi:flagellar biosynthesis/type III secretory pathway protein FliH